MAIYLHNWAMDTEQESFHEMIRDFGIEESDLEGVEIIVSSYTYEDYSGDAFVLFRHDGKLYEVNGSHCSCNGLGEQWNPEETTTEALLYRLERGYGNATEALALVRSALQ